MNRRLLIAVSGICISAAPLCNTASGQTWIGTSDTTWSNPANWSAGVPNSSSAIATFDAGSAPVGPIDLGPFTFGNEVSLAQITTTNLSQDITLTNSIPGGVLNLYGSGINGIIIAGGPTRTLTIENDIHLRNNMLFNNDPTGGRLVVNGNITSGSASDYTTLTLTGRNNTTANVIQINGVISDGATSETRLEAGHTPDGANHRAQVLVTGNNTFSGWVWVKTNPLAFTSIANIGQPSALGTGLGLDAAPVWLGSSGFTGSALYVGTAPAGHSTNRPIFLVGTTGRGRIVGNGVGPLVFNSGVQTSASVNNTILELDGVNTGNNAIHGVIEPRSGAGTLGIIKTGLGKWVLTGANTYDGNTTVFAGELVLQGSSARIGRPSGQVGSLMIGAGGTFTLDGGAVRAIDFQNAGAFNFRSGELNVIFAEAAGTGGSFVIGTDGPGTLRLTGGTKTFGAVTLNDSADRLSIESGGTYGFTSLDNSAGGTLSAVTANIQMNGGQLTTTHGEIRSRIQGTGGLTKVGDGMLDLTNSTIGSTYTGPTHIMGGTVRLISPQTVNSLPDTSPVFIAAEATLDITQMSGGETIGRLNGEGTILTAQFRGITVNTTAAANFGGTISGAGDFEKTGSAVQTLSGASNYTGNTTINGGTLILAEGGALNGTENVFVASGTMTIAGGSVVTPGVLRAQNNNTTLNLSSGSITALQLDTADGIQYLSTFNWTGGTIHLGSLVRVSGGVARDDKPFRDALTLTPAKTLIVDALFAVEGGGVVTLNGGSLTADNITTSSTGTLVFNSGTMRMRQDQTLTAERLMRLDVNTPLGAGRTLIIDGVATIEAPLTLAGGTFSAGELVNPHDLIVSSGTLNITTGGLNVAADTNVDLTTGTTVNAAGPSTNEGEINAINAILNFGGGLTNNGQLNLINTTVGGGMMHNASAALAGTNVFAADVSGAGHFTGGGTAVFEGTYAPGGSTAVVSFGGDVQFGPSARLQIEIGGTTPGAQHDELIITGGAALSGQLALGLIDGFAPALYDDEVRIINAASVSGGFTSVAGTMAMSGVGLAVVYESDGVKVVPAIPGDANLDRSVNISDLSIVAGNWQQSGRTWQSGDFSGSGIVNITDLSILAANWQAGVSGGTSMSFAEAMGMFDAFDVVVPEPGAVGLLGIAGLLVVRRGRSGRRA